jgi:hypothetical protein
VGGGGGGGGVRNYIKIYKHVLLKTFILG